MKAVRSKSKNEKDQQIIIKDNSLRSGAPFKIDEATKLKGILPGTCGFISYVIGPYNENKNIVAIKAVITRSGKNGKDRIETKTIAVEQYTSNISKRPDIKLPSNLKLVEFDKEYDTRLDINTISPIDFIGWAYSKVLFLERILNRNKFNKMPLFREELKSILDLEINYKEDETSFLEMLAAVESVKKRKEIFDRIKHYTSKLSTSIISYIMEVNHNVKCVGIRAFYRQYEIDSAGRDSIRDYVTHILEDAERNIIPGLKKLKDIHKPKRG